MGRSASSGTVSVVGSGIEDSSAEVASSDDGVDSTGRSFAWDFIDDERFRLDSAVFSCG